MDIRSGTRFGDWVTLEAFSGTTRDKIACRCDCGTERQVKSENLKRGLSTGCGCAKIRGFVERVTKHGTGYEDYRYRLWRTIVNKCFCESHRDYPYYGGRGITMYPDWELDYEAFASYIDSTLGPRPDGYTLDRIDNERHYWPGNLRWATRSEQALNRRDRRRLI